MLFLASDWVDAKEDPPGFIKKKISIDIGKMFIKILS